MSKSQKVQKIFTWSDVIACRNEIFGLAALWIILFHVEINVGFEWSGYLAMLVRLGNMGVDIFLFLSAVGLYKSISENKVKVFYFHRIMRVVVPYLVVAVIYFAWYDFVWLKDGVLQFLLNVSTVNFWLTGDHPTWYVAFIIIAYAVYPIIYKLDCKSHHTAIVVLIAGSVVGEYILMRTNHILFLNCERALSRVPIFLFGVLVAEYIWKKGKIRKEVLVGAVLTGIVIALVLLKVNMLIVLKRYLYGILAICIIIAYSYIRKFGLFKIVGTVFAHLGNISLEFYVVQVCLIRVTGYYAMWDKLSPSLWYVVMIVSTYILAQFISAVVTQRKAMQIKG